MLEEEVCQCNACPEEGASGVLPASALRNFASIAVIASITATVTREILTTADDHVKRTITGNLVRFGECFLIA